MTQALIAEERPDGLETVVLEIFRRALDDEALEPSDDFFAAGGHSILAVRVAGALAKAIGVRVPVALIFMHPTPDHLARAIADITPTRPVETPPAV